VKFLTWQNPEQLIVAQELIKTFKLLSFGIKDFTAQKHGAVASLTVKEAKKLEKY
jgi:hypothetical protein